MVFAALLTATMLAALDQLVFATALPTMVGELHGMAEIGWVTTAYIVASTVSLPVYGKLGDQLGRRRMFVVALLIFMAGSTIGMVAGSVGVLIVGRLVQGLGGGGIPILAQAIVAEYVPARRRGTYLGLLASVWAVAGLLGPLLGGLFADSLGWRWAFGINIPLGALTLLAILVLLPTRARAPGPLHFDGAGAILLAVGITALVLLISAAGEGGSRPPVGVPALAVVTASAPVAFVWVEWRAAEPILPLMLFRQRDFVIAAVAGMVGSIAMFGIVGYLPTWRQMTSGSGATIAGLSTLPVSLGIVVASTLGGVYIARTGRYRELPVIGGLAMAAGLWALSGTRASTDAWVLAAATLCFGAGMGLAIQTWMLVVQTSVPPEQVGTAVGANRFLGQVGSSVGLAVVGSIFAARLVDLLAARAPGVPGLTLDALSPATVAAMPPELRAVVAGVYEEALSPVYVALAPFVLLIAVLALFLTHRQLATTLQPAPVAAEPT
jgi:EmrB/QacA subfamily drug resistance transporter